MPAPAVKICGLSTPATLDAAIQAGATHVGLVHHPDSPRHVTLDQGAKLRAQVPGHVKTVLLLVNQQPQPTLEAIAAIRPDVVQFHGKETPEWLALLRSHVQVEVWKAFGLRDAAALERSRKYQGAADLLLFDAPANKLPGGNGLRLDWTLLDGFRPFMPWGLAGGLNPGNVADAIRRTGAPLVDVSSGVESEPGVKDAGLIRDFLAAARAVESAG
ncbi:phosphoribosylanthranilate isomerase [Croceibacterium ferulae]|uniref:phosphoribosylanthranilate isomerase n=1 Tax=Croceibacterium ferulae TaxID=1854641 RepID=UPI000EB473B9|nr:phosphoribosylanthranilate isomerase [Croceibacterium ferulae]